MSNLSIAYIFQQQQLLVDQDFQLPQVERLHNDLALSSDSLYTTNFIGPLSYQAFSFLKLLALS